MTFPPNRSLAAALVGLTLVTGTATAQETPEAIKTDATAISSSDTTSRVFQAEYFDQYVPTTALEMIRRIPGFQLDSGDNKRGLGQGDWRVNPMTRSTRSAG